MVLVGMDAAIREQPAEVELSAAAPRVLHRFKQNGVREEIAFLNHEVDLGDVHVHDAAGSDVQVPDFAVAHLPGGQPDVTPAGMDQRIGKHFEHPVVIWFSGESNGIGRRWRRVSPAIKNDENQWLVHGKGEILNESEISRRLLRDCVAQPSQTKASNLRCVSNPSLRYKPTAPTFASVTVRLRAANFRVRSSCVQRPISDSPIFLSRCSGRTQTWVMWPTSSRTREHSSRPAIDRVGLCSATNEALPSNTPQPGKRTILFRNRSEPFRLRY